MCFEPRDYLRHILAEADYLIGKSAGLTADQFMADETLRRAFVRSLEIIGEAARGYRMLFERSTPMWNGMLWLECVTGSFTVILALIMSLSGTWSETAYQS